MFYRLNVVRINVPPLQDRKDNIPILVDHFIKKYTNGTMILVTPESMEKLQTYNWPGNIRELENVIQSSLVLTQGNFLTIDKLPMTISSEKDVIPYNTIIKNGVSLKKFIYNTEKEFIIAALQLTNWNRTQAAKLLKIHRRFPYSKMKCFNISTKSKPDCSINKNSNA